MTTLPPNWHLVTDYAQRAETGHCTLRHETPEAITAQAWRIERGLAGVVWPEASGRWEQVGMFESE